MKLLAAYEMLTAKLESHDLPLTHPEIELYESALKVIGPLD